MSDVDPIRLKYLIHGLGVDIACHIPTAIMPISRAFNDFAATSIEPSGAITGSINPYDAATVRRCLSPTAVPLRTHNELAEIYFENERFWLIDDHWGLCELNLLKGSWRSWVLPDPSADAGTIIERAILWPIAQLLRPRGLCIAPAAAIVRDGWSALLLSNFSLEPELSMLVRSGWRIVGQNWTALHQDANRMTLLAMPGAVERVVRRVPPGSSTEITAAKRSTRVDLRSEFPGCTCESATCDAVLLVEPGRRPATRLAHLSPPNAAFGIRKSWGITELHPHRRQGHFLVKLAQCCKVFSVQLSREPAQFLNLLNDARNHRPASQRNVA